jgi:hypothetical protein
MHVIIKVLCCDEFGFGFGFSSHSACKFFQIIIVLDLSTALPLKYDEYTYPSWAQIGGVIFTFIPIMLVPIIGVTEFCKFPGNCKMVI